MISKITAEAWAIAREIALKNGGGSKAAFGVARLIARLPRPEPALTNTEADKLIAALTASLEGEGVAAPAAPLTTPVSLRICRTAQNAPAPRPALAAKIKAQQRPVDFATFEHQPVHINPKF